MAWYYGTYSCEHEGRVDITGLTKDRQRKADWYFEGLCPDCHKKKRRADYEQRKKEAQLKSEEMELPELTGTEKQVAWAVTLRMSALEGLEKRLEQLKEKGLSGMPLYSSAVSGLTTGEVVSYNEIDRAVEYGCCTYREARYWIDNRYNFDDILAAWVFGIRCTEDVPDEVKEEFQEIEKTLTVRPEHSCKDGVVKLEIDSAGNLLAKYVKDDVFRRVVKEKRFRWTGEAWLLEISHFTGSVDDRAAELGNALLLEGFTVLFCKEESKEMAVSGKFNIQQTNWISITHGQKEYLNIKWEGYNDGLYSAAKRLPGAVWRYNVMKVPVEYYKDVQDFAEILGFQFSKGALKAIESYAEQEKQYEIKAIEKAEIGPYEDKLRKILESSGAIIEDLRDDA